VYETVQPMELFVTNDFHVDPQGRIFPQMGWFSGAFSFPAIREHGRVWMTVTPNEINTIQPAVQQSHGKVLTYGLGLGYYAFHALLKGDVTSVTVVEKNPQVIDVFKRLLLPFFPRQQDLHIVEARCGGELARTSYSWKTLMEKGCTVSNGSDCPVEQPDVMAGIQCAVTRRDLKGQGPYLESEAFTVREALDSFTKAGAYASFEEKIKGEIRPGMLADFTVLGGDPFETDAAKLEDIPIRATWLDGKRVFPPEL